MVRRDNPRYKIYKWDGWWYLEKRWWFLWFAQVDPNDSWGRKKFFSVGDAHREMNRQIEERDKKIARYTESDAEFYLDNGTKLNMK